MIYWELFLSFLQIGAFSFGGGYAAMPLIQAEVVIEHGWLEMAEFADLITISQMTPGPIAINSATFVGEKIAGVGGAVAATLGCILPSCIIVTMIAWLYMRYRKLDALQSVLSTLRPAVVAMIAAAGVAIIISAFWGESAVTFANLKISSVLIFAVCMILLMKYKKDPVFVMVAAGIMNVIITVVLEML